MSLVLTRGETKRAVKPAAATFEGLGDRDWRAIESLWAAFLNAVDARRRWAWADGELDVVGAKADRLHAKVMDPALQAHPKWGEAKAKLDALEREALALRGALAEARGDYAREAGTAVRAWGACSPAGRGYVAAIWGTDADSERAMRAWLDTAAVRHAVQPVGALEPPF